MKTSEDGINLIIRFEGLKLKAYYCPAGKLTIGYGHTGVDVRPGMVITKAQALDLLRSDLDRFECAVARLVTVPLNDNQHAALVSFAYNTGEGALAQSTLLKRLNAGDYRAAATQFLAWNRAKNPKTGNKEVLPGLTTRRQAERTLFLAPSLAALAADTFVIPPAVSIPAVIPADTRLSWKGFAQGLRSLFGGAK